MKATTRTENAERSPASTTEPKRGVEASREELAALRPAARAIDLGRPARVSSRLSGPHRSPFRGRGMEFAEVRAYTPGDEVRHIDWRVTARTGRPHSKLFEEERERPVLVLSDGRSPMRFGTRQCFKSVAAARWAALLVWAGVDRGDRVGGVTLTDGALSSRRLRRNKNSIGALIGDLADATTAECGAPDISLANALREVRRIACVGAEVFLISDFADLDDEASRHLAHLARYAATHCICVHDPLESRAPDPGEYRISNGAAVASLRVGNRASREAWVASFEARSRRLEELCSQNRATLGFLSTASDALGFMPERRTGATAAAGLMSPATDAATRGTR
jgi:uncharacterized protein (DUF58 family)